LQGFASYRKGALVDKAARTVLDFWVYFGHVPPDRIREAQAIEYSFEPGISAEDREQWLARPAR